MTVFGTTQAAAATAVSRASHVHTHTYPSNGARALYAYICFCTAQYSKQRDDNKTQPVLRHKPQLAAT